MPPPSNAVHARGTEHYGTRGPAAQSGTTVNARGVTLSWPNVFSPYKLRVGTLAHSNQMCVARVMQKRGYYKSPEGDDGFLSQDKRKS